ncbi:MULTISPECIES: SecDF P1 head subdomain-containing protein [Polymorphospora]|uniref:SecDF P1 head subdomain domain-containing protein n=1 Tax=Polymorphospora lycopeni TaxID=3140240 RepID=A0ABV5CPK0_9ACTN
MYPAPPPAGPPPPATGVPRPDRTLVVVVAVLAGAALLGILACGGAAFLLRDRLLGDSRATTLTVEAVTADGSAPGRADLERTRDVLADRLAAAELDRPSVDIEGDRLVLRVGGTGHEDDLRSLAGTGELGFRRVLGAVADQGTGGATPSTPDQGPVPARDEVAAKLGPAYRLAETITTPGPLDPATVRGLAPFAALTPAEVAALPPDMRFRVPTVTCAQLTAWPVGGPATEPTVACDAADPPVKYLLDVVRVGSADVGNAEAKPNQTGQWIVAVSFTDAGQRRWTDLTRETAGAGSDNQVAVVLDNLVVSAPAVQGVITGDTEISGRFTRDRAMLLAAQIGSDPLPLVLRVVG